MAKLTALPHLTEDQTTIFASASRTASANSDDFSHIGFKGVRLFLDVSAVTGTTPTLDVKIQAKDKLSGNYVDLTGAAFAQKTATGTDYLTIYPGIAETANETVSDLVPNAWRAVATIGGTTPDFTFSLSAEYLV